MTFLLNHAYYSRKNPREGKENNQCMLQLLCTSSMLHFHFEKSVTYSKTYVIQLQLNIEKKKSYIKKKYIDNALIPRNENNIFKQKHMLW